jgi:hypothetical protein
MFRSTVRTLLPLALVVLLTACSRGAQRGPVAEPTPLSVVTEVLQISTPTPPAEAAAEATAVPSGTSVYRSSALGIQFAYPAAWYLQEAPDGPTLTSFDPSNPPHKLEWTDQTIQLHFGLLPEVPSSTSFDAWVEDVKQTALTQHLDVTAEERFLVANQSAERLTLVSGSGGVIDRVLTILNGRYFVIDIQGNYPGAAEVLASVEPLSAASLKPPDSDSPAAGICAQPQEDPVPVILGLGPDGLPLGGRCIEVSLAQRIQFINRTGARLHMQLGEYVIDLADGEEATMPEPVGSYLAPGVHFLDMGPELWVREQTAP